LHKDEFFVVTEDHNGHSTIGILEIYVCFSRDGNENTHRGFIGKNWKMDVEKFEAF
jgi:hypothetical protein